MSAGAGRLRLFTKERVKVKERKEGGQRSRTLCKGKPCLDVQAHVCLLLIGAKKL